MESVYVGGLKAAPGWFTKSVPQLDPWLDNSPFLLLLPDSYVPFDRARFAFHSADNLYRPDAVGAFWAALREQCRLGEYVSAWMIEYIVYVAMGIKYIKK